MKINSITTRPYNTNFSRLKYQSGIKTKAILTPELKEFLAANEARINKLKCVDIIASDLNNIFLDIKNTRYFDPKYERFYNDGNCGINLNDDNVINIWSSNNATIHELRELKPVNKNTPGIYSVNIAAVIGFLALNPDYSWTHSPEAILKCAELIDASHQKINDAEFEYGMDCVKVLEETDKLVEYGHRLDLIDNVKNTYNFEQDDILNNMPTEDLEALFNNKEDVENLKYYGITINKDSYNYVEPMIHDKYGYIDDKYSDYYGDNGYVIFNNKEYDRFKIAQVEREYPVFTIFSKNNDNKYICFVDFYDGGSRLSSFGGTSFNELVQFTKTLDKIANSINEAQKKGLIG